MSTARQSYPALEALLDGALLRNPLAEHTRGPAVHVVDASWVWRVVCGAWCAVRVHVYLYGCRDFRLVRRAIERVIERRRKETIGRSVHSLEIRSKKVEVGLLCPEPLSWQLPWFAKDPGVGRHSSESMQRISEVGST